MIEVTIGVQDTMLLNPEHISSISRQSPSSCMVVMANGREYHIRETKENVMGRIEMYQENQLIRRYQWSNQ